MFNSRSIYNSFNSRMSHSFHTDFTGVSAKELSLQDVLKEFHNGKMHAFSGACTFDKLDKVTN